jgi:enoyl-CoA hydratase/carnithine racemase
MAIEVTEPEPGITLVTISNPARRNALDAQMFCTLADLWPRLAASSCRCIVVTGAGGTFCSGADLSARLAERPDVDELVERAFLKSTTCAKPMVAAIEGACVAGGLELALACDIRICGRDAKLGLPEPRWGLFPAGGGAMRLVEEVGYGPAADLLLTGRLIDAEESLRLGLVTRIASAEETPLQIALTIARCLATNSPAALRAIKTYLSAARRPEQPLRALELALTRELRGSPDAAEGIAAFLGKRVPVYSDPAPQSRPGSSGFKGHESS